MKVEHQPIRVLHIVGGVMDVGGIEMFLMNYYRHIDRTIIQFDFCIVEEGEGYFDQEIQTLGGIIYNLPSKKKHLLRHIYNLMAILRDYRHLPVHLHLDGMNGFYGLIMLLNKNKIRISHSHNTNHLTTNHLRRLLHNTSRLLNRLVNNYFVACSKESSIWLHGKKNTQNYILIRNAIDTEKFKFNKQTREEYRKKFGISDELVIGHVGRFHPQKNHHSMIRIAIELTKLDCNFKMVFIGNGELFDEINSIVNVNNLNDKVLFIGKTDTPENYYHMFDLFLLPSLYEGLGISLVEAQTNGLTCFIAANIPQEAIFNSNVKRLAFFDEKSWSEKIINLDTNRVAPITNPYKTHENIISMTNFYKRAIQL